MPLGTDERDEPQFSPQQREDLIAALQAIPEDIPIDEYIAAVDSLTGGHDQNLDPDILQAAQAQVDQYLATNDIPKSIEGANGLPIYINLGGWGDHNKGKGKVWVDGDRGAIGDYSLAVAKDTSPTAMDVFTDAATTIATAGLAPAVESILTGDVSGVIPENPLETAINIASDMKDASEDESTGPSSLEGVVIEEDALTPSDILGDVAVSIPDFTNVNEDGGGGGSGADGGGGPVEEILVDPSQSSLPSDTVGDSLDDVLLPFPEPADRVDNPEHDWPEASYDFENDPDYRVTPSIGDTLIFVEHIPTGSERQISNPEASPEDITGTERTTTEPPEKDTNETPVSDTLMDLIVLEGGLSTGGRTELTQAEYDAMYGTSGTSGTSATGEGELSSGGRTELTQEEYDALQGTTGQGTGTDGNGEGEDGNGEGELGNGLMSTPPTTQPQGSYDPLGLFKNFSMGDIISLRGRGLLK
jgi:hypothetical protein